MSIAHTRISRYFAFVHIDVFEAPHLNRGFACLGNGERQSPLTSHFLPHSRLGGYQFLNR